MNYKEHLDKATTLFELNNEVEKHLIDLFREYNENTNSNELVLNLSDERQNVWVGDASENSRFGAEQNRVSKIDLSYGVEDYSIIDELGDEYSPEGVDMIKLYYACALAVSNN